MPPAVFLFPDEQLPDSFFPQTPIFLFLRLFLPMPINFGSKFGKQKKTCTKLYNSLEFDTANVDIKQINNQRQRHELLARLEELNARLDFKEHKANAVFVLKIPVKGDGL